MTTKTVDEPKDLAQSKNTLATLQRDILKNARQELEYVIQCGADLQEIEQFDLYKQKKNPETGEEFKSFKEFAEVEYVKTSIFSWKEVNRRITYAILGQSIFKALDDYEKETQTKLPAPTAQFQFQPFQSFSDKPTEAGQLWIKMATYAKKKNKAITAQFIEDYKRFGEEEDVTPTPQPASWSGADEPEQEPTDITFDQPAGKVWSAASIATLDLISKAVEQNLLPPDSRERIENESVIISSTNLEDLGRRDNDQFIKIARLVLQGVPYTTAFKAIVKKLLPTSSLTDLVHVAMAFESGKASIEFDNYKVTAAPTK